MTTLNNYETGHPIRRATLAEWRASLMTPSGVILVDDRAVYVEGNPPHRPYLRQLQLCRALARQQFALADSPADARANLHRQCSQGIALWVASGREAGDDIAGALRGPGLVRCQRAYSGEYRRLCREVSRG